MLCPIHVVRACTAINVAVSGAFLGHYVKRGCSVGNASKPEWQNGPGWTRFHFAALPRPVPPAAMPLPSGFVLDLIRVFASTIRDGGGGREGRRAG